MGVAEEKFLDPAALRGGGVWQCLHWLASGRTTAEALAEAYLGAIERLDPRLHAFVDVRPDIVRDQAASAQRRRREGPIGRLDGIPVAVKDNFDVAGYPTRAGLPSRGSDVARHDAHAIARLRAAGAIILGKTNLDEGALGAATCNPHFGTTRNPCNDGYVAGGSSGGSAAAVAAGLAPRFSIDDGDVPDPYTGTPDDFDAVLGLIRRGIDALGARLRAGGVPR